MQTQTQTTDSAVATGVYLQRDVVEVVVVSVVVVFEVHPKLPKEYK